MKYKDYTAMCGNHQQVSKCLWIYVKTTLQTTVEVTWEISSANLEYIFTFKSIFGVLSSILSC